MAETVAVVLKGYPRLSETFIAQEIRAPAAYLPEYLGDEPRRVVAGWRRARRLSGYQQARRAFLRDLRRNPTPNRLRRFG